jgi:phosphonate transport system ATP-binding protein
MLAVQNISKVYDNGTQALDDISFDVKPGEFVSIIGPSGAGKSTILRTINRLIDITSGSITFKEQDITKANKREIKKVRTNMGMIFQHYNLVSRLTAVENVLHGRLGYKNVVAGSLGFYSEEEKEQAFDLLEKVGLAKFAYNRCDQLSGGQKQRVGIARALMQDPELILCDEPIASLDPKSSKDVMNYLKRISREMGIACIVNLHQVEVAIQYSDRIIGVNSGNIVYDGEPSGLTHEMIASIYGDEMENLAI